MGDSALAVIDVTPWWAECSVVNIASLREGGDHDAIFAENDTIKGVQVLAKSVIFLKGRWELVLKLWESRFNYGSQIEQVWVAGGC